MTTIHTASRSPLEGLMHWFREHLRGNELSHLDRSELELMARDLNISSDDLTRLSTEEPKDISLMKQMMALHGLDYDALRKEYSGVVRDMEVTCSRCADRKLCEHDLATGADAHTCDTYCPNADTMKAFAGG
ncbi:MAG TPA: DUF6455 family protein [Beijerinckiaceae bacterium]|nr:DUF6455 family protein [Beijerinckiaceae bacterium]